MPCLRDIEQCTPDGHYRVDVPLDHLERQIGRYVTEFSFEDCPDFQRGHVWDEARQIAYVEHVLRGGTGSTELRFNHPAWMNFRRSQPEDYLVLVDGLQRLTACLRFLRNEIPAFGHCLGEYEDQFGLARYSLSFRVNDLLTRADVLRWYLEINAGGVVHTDEELERVRALLAEESGV